MTLPEPSQPFRPELVKKLIFKKTGGSKDNNDNNNKKPTPKRITNEALLVSAELLRLFVEEARHRAGIEAECEKEGSAEAMDVDDDDDDDDEKKERDKKTVIRGDHITKVAAELLMDFS